MNNKIVIVTLLAALVSTACGSAPSAPTAVSTTASRAVEPTQALAEPTKAMAQPATAAPESANAVGSGPGKGTKLVTIGVVQQVSHPALNAAVQGMIDVLKENGYEDGKNIKLDLENAANDIPALATIAKKFKDDKVDYVVPIGTLPAQNVLTVFKDSSTPIFFSTVADIQGAGIAKSFTDKPDNITGIQAKPPVEDAMKLIFEIVPNAKKIGMIWTTSEKNSEASTIRARALAKQMNFELDEATITKADEVLQAAQSLAAKKVDAIFISTDSTTVSALESVVKVATESKIPLFGNDPDSSKRGAVCAVGLDYYDNGRNGGLQLIKALKGQATAKDLTIEDQKKGLLACNTKAAELEGVTIPDAVLTRAEQKFSEITAPAK